MGSWVAAIVETGGRADFWDVARRQDVKPVDEGVPAHVLIECELGWDFTASLRLAETLSRALATSAIGFYGQSSADCYEICGYSSGERVRRLAYSRDEGGWLHVEGTPQPWERAFFFDGKFATSSVAEHWPDMLDDELSDQDIRRYESARRAGDASAILDLLHPSSLAPLHRVCAHFGLRAEAPTARWKKRSWWARLFR